MSGGTHEGHRARLKTRFLKEGLDSFCAHEVVELLLFYAIPQRDVNETAHRLIERFGSLPGVLEADIEELESVDGVGAHAATMLKLMSAVTRRYEMERGGAELRYTSARQIGKYLVDMYIGITVERSYILLFDNGMKLLDVINAGDGVLNSVTLSSRMVVENAFKRNASVVVIAHNHPNGTVLPSREDLATTVRLKQVLENCGVTLLEHFIVSGNYYNVIMGRNGGQTALCGDIGISMEDFYKDVNAFD